jgi:LPS-assembly protein
MRWCVFLLVCALAGPRAVADFKPTGLSDFSADNMSQDPTTGEYKFWGHPRLQDGQLLITADTFSYDPTADIVTATGNVAATRGDERLLADLLIYHRAAKTLYAQHIRIGRVPFYISGESAQGTLDRLVVQRATVTYGEPGRWAPTIKADSIVWSPGHYIRLGPSMAGLGYGQIVPIPHLNRNLIGGSPILSYLSLNVGYRSILGGIADVGLRVPINPDVKVGGDVGIFTSRGVMAGPSADYAFMDNALFGTLRSGFISDYGLKKSYGEDDLDLLGNTVHRDRAFVDWSQEGNLTPDLTFNGQVNWWTDPDIVRDFHPHDWVGVQEPDNYLESTYTYPNAFLSGFVRFQPNLYEQVQQRLPELRFDLLPIAIGDGFYERFNGSAVHLLYDPPNGSGPELSDNRLDLFYGISRPIAPTPWFSFTPVAGARLTNYSDTVGAAEDGGYTRALGEVGFDALLRSSGTFNYENPLWDVDGLRHLLTPVVSYRYIPDADAGASRIPAIDVPTFNTYLQPLDLGDLRYIDRLAPENTLRIGLNNTLQTRDPTYGSRDLFQFNLADDIYFTRPPGVKDYSDLHAEFSATPASWVSLSDVQVFDPVSFTLREIEAGINFHDDSAWGMQLNGDFVRHEDDDYSLDTNMRLTEVYRARVIVEYGARQFRFNTVEFGIEQILGHIWRVDYYLSFNSGPNQSGHFGFNAELEAIKF